MLGMFRHQLAAELERVLTCRMGELIHEAFEIDGVLVDVHSAPEAGRYMRVAHRVIDQHVRDAVADGRLGTPGVEALEGRGILAVLESFGPHGGEDRLAGDAHAQPGEISGGIQGADHLCLGDRMIVAVRHVLLARPQQLYGRARHLFCYEHRLGDKVVERTASAEAAAKHQLVHVAFVGG